MATTPFPRVNVLGVGVHALNMQQTIEFLLDSIRQKRKGYVCVTGVHGIMEAQKNCRFRCTLNESLLTTPDGMPTVWLGKMKGHRAMGRVFGPDLMIALCRESARLGLKHFLYGGVPTVAEQLKHNLETWFPGLEVVGTYTPPFRPLSFEEHFDLVRRVNTAKPDIIWVGLSTPKQERFMAEYISKFNCSLMLGVGAAFDLHTGRMTDSPEWVKRSGLQWAHRLIQNPRRLWRRYLINNPKFIAAISAQLLGLREYKLPARSAISTSNIERAA